MGGIGHRKRGKLTYQELRRARLDSPIDSVIVAARRIAGSYYWQPWRSNPEKFGLRVVPHDYADERVQIPEEVERRCREAEELLAEVSWEGHQGKYEGYVTELIEDELTIDHKCVEVLLDRDGRPAARHVLDGATIYPVLSLLDPHMQEFGLPDSAAGRGRGLEQLSYQHQIDLTDAAYVQIIEGMVQAAWRDVPVRGDTAYLSVDITQPMPVLGWKHSGFSLLEQSIESTRFYVDSWRYNHELINLNYPEGVLLFPGATDQQGLNEFKAQINASSTYRGPKNQQRLHVLSMPEAAKSDGETSVKPELLKLRDTPKDLAHPELFRILTAHKCGCFRMHPATINSEIDRGGGPRLGNDNQDLIFSQAHEEGLYGLLNNIANFETRTVLARHPRFADLKVVHVRKLVSMHPGLTYSFEGEQREQADTLASLARGFVVALILIYALLAIPFRFYIQPFVVMTAIPFGFIGAIGGHFIMGFDLTILSLFGIVALTGVVVNDSLIMVDFINRKRAEGLPLRIAIRDAGVSRFRPIVLTSLTTFLGLTPMLLERSLQARFLIPMATSLAFGVLFATFVTMIMVPVTYMIQSDFVSLIRRARSSGNGRRESPDRRIDAV